MAAQLETESPDNEAQEKTLIYFTDSEDDSVASDDESLNENEKRLAQVFWRTRNWIILQNQGAFKLLMNQTTSCAFIFTPVSLENEMRDKDRSFRFVSVESKLQSMIKNLTQGMNLLEGTQPLMMKFLRYISYEKSSIPAKFLLPLEQKLIMFNENRQR